MTKKFKKCYKSSYAIKSYFRKLGNQSSDTRKSPICAGWLIHFCWDIGQDLAASTVRSSLYPCLNRNYDSVCTMTTAHNGFCILFDICSFIVFKLHQSHYYIYWIFRLTESICLSGKFESTNPVTGNRLKSSWLLRLIWGYICRAIAATAVRSKLYKFRSISNTIRDDFHIPDRLMDFSTDYSIYLLFALSALNFPLSRSIVPKFYQAFLLGL